MLRGICLEDEFDEGGVQIVSDLLVTFLLGDELVCKWNLTLITCSALALTMRATIR